MPNGSVENAKSDFLLFRPWLARAVPLGKGLGNIGSPRALSRPRHRYVTVGPGRSLAWRFDSPSYNIDLIF